MTKSEGGRQTKQTLTRDLPIARSAHHPTNAVHPPASPHGVFNVQPAYAEGFGVAGAHLSRRSESEGGTPNSESVREQALNEEEGRDQISKS